VLSLQDLGRNHHSPCISSCVLVAMLYLGRRGCRPSGIPFSKPTVVCRSTLAREDLRPSGLGDRLTQRILPDCTWLNSDEDFCGMVFFGFFLWDATLLCLGQRRWGMLWKAISVHIAVGSQMVVWMVESYVLYDALIMCLSDGFWIKGPIELVFCCVYSRFRSTSMMFLVC
jgi:hypothetical protein